MPVIIEFSRCIGTYSSAKYELKSRTAVQDQASGTKDEIKSEDVTLKEDKSDVGCIDMTQGGAADHNQDGISDELTRLMCDGTILTGDGTKVFGDYTYEQVQEKDDLDADGLLNGEEITLKMGKNNVPYVVLNSSPIMLDTDADGINDADDTAPLIIGLEGGVVGSVRIIGRHTDGAIFIEGHSYIIYTSYIDNQTISVEDIYNAFAFNSDYEEAVAADETLLSWSTTVEELNDDNAAYRKEIADDMWNLVDENDSTKNTVTLNRGDYVSIGNYTMTSYTQSIYDAVMGSESGTMMEMAVLQGIYESIVNEEVDITYIMTHLEKVIEKVALESYVLDQDVIDGTTDGGIWFNREMYNQKYQYSQYPNEMYEVEVTQQQLDDMVSYFSSNSYYSVMNHNCSTVSTGAWNAAVGYERNEDGTYKLDENGDKIQSELYVSARGEGIYSIFDIPGAVCNAIRNDLPDETTNGSYLGEKKIVKGESVVNTVNTQVNVFTNSADTVDEDDDATTKDELEKNQNDASDEVEDTSSGTDISDKTGSTSQTEIDDTSSGTDTLDETGSTNQADVDNSLDETAAGTSEGTVVASIGAIESTASSTTNSNEQNRIYNSNITNNIVNTNDLSEEEQAGTLIDEEETPLADAEETSILDEETPLADGNELPSFQWGWIVAGILGIVVLSGAGCVFYLKMKKKKQQ